MTEEQTDRVLADCLEAYHRQRARGERPDLEAFREQLGPLHGEFLELVAAETAIDEALDPGPEMPLPQAWGKYTILREIARGAAGVVYEAVHRELGRTVALKILRTGLDTDATTRERFAREAKALAQVEHDHIVKVYEAGEVDGRPFYAMSLVSGPTLADLCKRGELPSPRDVCEGLAGVANALQCLHESQIVHRDVKPSNIMIAPNGRYMLADFGLARTAAALDITRTGDAMGTPLYMSPEQMLGDRKAVDARSDIYGLGATLYQMLTGRPPFKSDNLHALMRMVFSQRPESARAVAPDLPVGCSRIAMKCLEKEQRDRYQSAADLEVDLRRFVEGARVEGRPLSLRQRGLRRVVRNPVWSAAAMLLLAFGAWLALKPPPPPPPPLLSVQVDLPAFVRLDETAETLPAPLVEYPLPRAGDYQVEITPQDAAYKPLTYPVQAKAGERQKVTIFLEPRDANNAEALAAARAGADLPAGAPGEPLERDRAAEQGPPIELRFPRGKVRMEDLERWEAYVQPTGLPEEGGVLEFRAGDTLLGSAPFPLPDRQQTDGAMGAELLAQLSAGMQVTWTFRTHSGKRLGQPARFEIVEADLGPRFERIAQRLATWSPDTRAHFSAALEAEVLLKEGLYTAAYRRVRPFVDAGNASQHMIVLQKSALEAIFKAMVEAADSPAATRAVRREVKSWKLWSDMQVAYARFDGAQWEAYFEALAGK